MILLEGPAGAETLKKYLILPIKRKCEKLHSEKQKWIQSVLDLAKKPI